MHPCRFQLGEGITKKESDLAADVEEQQQALQAKAAQKKEAAPEAAAPQQPQQPAVKVTRQPIFVRIFINFSLILVKSYSSVGHHQQ